MFLLPVLIVDGICSIASAAIALLITLFNTVRQLRLAASLRLSNTLSEVLLRDGAFVNADTSERLLKRQ